MARHCRYILAVALLSLLVTGIGGAAPEEIKTLAIGAVAPDFALPGVDGKTHKLCDYDAAKVLVIVFTCNHCPTAQAYEPRLKKLVTDYKDKGVALVAISPNDPLAVRLDELGYTDVGDTLEDMKSRVQDKRWNFPYLYDGETQKVAQAYGPMTTPHVFVFDRQRKLRFAGRIDDNERHPDKVTSHDTRNAIEALLKGEPVPVETTKTFGCSIKWASKRGSAAKSLEQWAAEPVKLEGINLAGIGQLLKNDTDKLRVVNIWSTRCGPCVIEFPEFVTMNRMYRRRDFEMVSVSVDGTARRDKALDFLKEKQASFKNYLYDAEDIYAFIEAVDKDWPGAIPYTLLIEPGGDVIYRHLGLIDPLEVRQAIVEYLGRTYQ